MQFSLSFFIPSSPPPKKAWPFQWLGLVMINIIIIEQLIKMLSGLNRQNLISHVTDSTSVHQLINITIKTTYFTCRSKKVCICTHVTTYKSNDETYTATLLWYMKHLTFVSHHKCPQPKENIYIYIIWPKQGTKNI